MKVNLVKTSKLEPFFVKASGCYELIMSRALFRQDRSSLALNWLKENLRPLGPVATN